MANDSLPHNGCIASRQEIVDRAEAFIKSHIGEPIAIAQLCRVTGVSERTLRSAFNDLRGKSPMRFLMDARLDRVHDALRRHRRGRATVTAVATDYGFYELGRFAGKYKAMFGERPSDTVRSSAQPSM